MHSVVEFLVLKQADVGDLFELWFFLVISNQEQAKETAYIWTHGMLASFMHSFICNTCVEVLLCTNTALTLQEEERQPYLKDLSIVSI